MASLATVPHFDLCIPADRYHDVPSRLMQDILSYAESNAAIIGGRAVLQFQIANATIVSDICLSLAFALIPYTLLFFVEGR